MKQKLSNSNRFSFKTNEKWFDQLPEKRGGRNEEEEMPDAQLILALSAEANNIMDSETARYKQMKENSRDKDHLWVKRILQTGTLSDKVSAHCLLLQEAPPYNLNHLLSLVNMVNTKGRRECIMAMDALQELFTNHLLPPDRKLRRFKEQPFLRSLCAKDDPLLRSRCLLLCLFEEKLKSFYGTFVSNVSEVSIHDTVEKSRRKATALMATLLGESPEQEQFLLGCLVNKLGDPSASVASQCCYLLCQLLVQHPQMKGVVVEEVQRLLLRPNLKERAKYYCLCFLNQIILCNDDSSLANRLISLYFSHFRACVGKGEVESRTMGALMRGVSRAYPYSKMGGGGSTVMVDHLDACYRLVHLAGSFNLSVQALALIFQVLDSKGGGGGVDVCDRFYSTLYRKLMDPGLRAASRQHPQMLNLLYRALGRDTSIVRVKALCKRMLQITLHLPPHLQCSVLVLLSKIIQQQHHHPHLMGQQQGSIVCGDDSDEEEHYEDVRLEDDEDDSKEEETKTKEEPKSSWVHRTSTKRSKLEYDVHARNPLHAGAQFTSLWELNYMRQSFHPSVSLFAQQLINDKEIRYSGDPLQDFTLSRFLDRFVYRNPKKKNESEHYEKNVHARVFGRKEKEKEKERMNPNTHEYLQQNKEKIPPEERYIYDYLQKRAADRRKDKKDDDDLESVASEDFEALLDSVLPEDEGKRKRRIDEDDHLDFAKELGLKDKKRKKKKKMEEETDSEEDEDVDEDVDLDEEELELDLEDADDDLCEEDFVGLDAPAKTNSKKKRKTDSLTDANLLASAEEFSALLEENAGSKMDTLTEGALISRDKAAAKQIAWEVNRHRFVKGYNNNKRKRRNMRRQ